MVQTNSENVPGYLSKVKQHPAKKQRGNYYKYGVFTCKKYFC